MQPIRPAVTAAAIDHRLTDGAVRLLQTLHLLAEEATEFVILTQELATHLRRTTNIIQSQQDELATAGYLRHSTDQHTGATRYTLLPVTPPPGWDAPEQELPPPSRS
jgi:D-ribose pyranose/furanose isomerase RbsD